MKPLIIVKFLTPYQWNLSYGNTFSLAKFFFLFCKRLSCRTEVC